MLYCCRRMSFCMSLGFFSLSFSLSLSRSDQRLDGSCYLMFFFRLLFVVGAYLALPLHRSNRVLVVCMQRNISRFSCACSMYIEIHLNESMQTSNCINVILIFFWLSERIKENIFLCFYQSLLDFFCTAKYDQSLFPFYILDY